jgi:5-methyltetrahydrofolate--homocysteine methyltransferase
MEAPGILRKRSGTDYCSIGAEAFFVDATVDFLQEIECDSDFPEKILDAEVESGGLRILIRSQDDVDILDQYQYMINRPVSICSESPELLEAALKIYNGRAFSTGHAIWKSIIYNICRSLRFNRPVAISAAAFAAADSFILLRKNTM